MNEIISGLTYGVYNDVTAITINNGQFKGAQYTYGKVSFPEGEEPVMSFDYDIVNCYKPVDLDAFEKLIGDILVEVIKKTLSEESTIFTGGTDVVEGGLSDNK